VEFTAHYRRHRDVVRSPDSLGVQKVQPLALLQLAVSEPKKHHYLPVMYQVGFLEHQDGRLCLYDRKTQRYSRAHPKNICFERELYTIDPHGRQDRRIESEWLSRVDGDGATAIRQFQEGGPIGFSLEVIRTTSGS